MVPAVRQVEVTLEGAEANPDADGRARVGLVVDQFEGIFTQCDDEEERAAVVRALHLAAVEAGVVVLAMRADLPVPRVTASTCPDAAVFAVSALTGRGAGGARRSRLRAGTRWR